MRRVCFFFFVSLCCITQNVSAQENSDIDFGGIFSAKVSADISRRWSLGVEEELRLRNNFATMDRLATTLNGDYSIIRDKLSAGALYSLQIDQTKSKLYQYNHRLGAQFEFRQNLNKLRLTTRVRYQSTYRQEVEKPYKVNPKNYLRGRVEASYTPWGSRISHSLSAEAFYLFHPNDSGVAKYRLQYSAEYRLNRREKIELSIRLDKPLLDKSEPYIVALGVAYRFKMR